jgi:hypothetical protein
MAATLRGTDHRGEGRDDRLGAYSAQRVRLGAEDPALLLRELGLSEHALAFELTQLL